jgi:phage terminase Nu1 subunit (DNA packaging protein)
MSDSGVPHIPQRPDLTLWELADRLELMAQALRSLSDARIKRDVIHEMRILLVQAEHKLMEEQREHGSR